MWIAALEASLARCSAAILADGIVVAAAAQEGERGHAASLPPLLDTVLAEAGVRAGDLDAVAAGVGPGSFTGLRAALALAGGLAVAAGLPGIGVTTGEALVAALPAVASDGRALWTAIDNRRGRVALERFGSGGAAAPSAPAEVFSLDALPVPRGPILVLGDAAEAVAAALRAVGVDAEGRHSLPLAEGVARVAALRLCGRLAALGLQPLYLEPPAVRLPAAVA